MSSPALKNFEKNMEQLQKLVASMGSSEISLASSLESYKQGVSLIADCQKALAEVEQAIHQINPDLTLESFNVEADDSSD